MTRTSLRRRASLGTVAAATTVATALGGSAAVADIPDGTQFYVGKPNHDAVRQIAELTSEGRKTEAAQIRDIISTPTAIWVEGGSPKEATQQVRQITRQAAGKGTVPVLVLYNIPFRDCAQYSAGGATTMAEYKAWIDGVVAGIGDREVVIALEPDGLGIIPWYDPRTDTDNADTPDVDESKVLEWCQPAEADPATASAERFEMLNYAVDALKGLPNTSVYLDGTHDGWLGVGDVSDRLIQAGVTRADGFFLNASNYRWTDRLVKYGEWIAQCIYLSESSWWQQAWCASQYYPANPDDFSTWGLSDAAYDKAFADTGLARDYSAMPHFIIDTSRNGQGPWTPSADDFVIDTPPLAPGQDLESWCNPPDRGIGLKPTTDTGNELVDAYVWIKVPGESDGSCRRGFGDALGGVDPVWGIVDPAAGEWFEEQARELAALADPPLNTSRKQQKK